MKKSNLMRQVVCAVLALGTVTVGTTAMAESLTVTSGQTHNAQAISINANETLSNAGTVEATDSITVDGGFFINKNAGTLKTGTLTISGHVSDQSKIAGEIHATNKFLYKGIAGNLAQREVTASIYTPVLHIQGNTYYTGFKITSDNVLKKCR